MKPAWITLDGNEAAASVAYRVSEVCAIYPITPASQMGEWADEWASEGRANVWGAVPTVVEMQSEAGAAGAVHGALQTGALATTFTASQGLLLMIPNMYKIAGELSPAVIHVAARTVATHALSIFGDHSDVMAVRPTGWAMLCSGSVQEAQDLALVAHAATLDSRVPFVHFFDGFRTSHEVAKIAGLSDDEIRAMIDEDAVFAHRARSLDPDRPVVRGTAQNPDVFFQAREAANPFHAAVPSIVARTMDRLAALVGRRYGLFEYAGHPEAERVVVMMGSGAEAAHETVDRLAGRGERVGVVKVRLFRPFDAAALLAAIPASARAIAVLDRTKEPGSAGEPLLQDVQTAVLDAAAAGRWVGTPPRVVGGRYGLSSKEFTPAMVRAVLDELLEAVPKARFTIGITDDVSGTSLPFEADGWKEDGDVRRAVFYGLGSDGTVGAAKNSVKIIGEETPFFAQGYFVYDSKKAGSITVSHLRFGPRPIRSTYLVREAHLVGVHHPSFLERHDVLAVAAPGATVLLNTPLPPEEVWGSLPVEAQSRIVERGLELHAIDAAAVAADAGLPGRVNVVMQTCFFALGGVLPRDEAIAAIKEAIGKTYGRKGEAVVRRNREAVDRALDRLRRVPVPGRVTTDRRIPPPVPDEAPAFVRDVTGPIIAGRGDDLPVSAMPIDGTFPVGTSRWERRKIAPEVPVWDETLCIQCNKCVVVCPHATIRAKVVPAAALGAGGGDGGLPSAAVKGREVETDGEARYVLQVAPEDCTGCGICVEVCPARAKDETRRKAITMEPLAEVRDREAARWARFLELPEVDRRRTKRSVKGVGFFQPLFEASGACAGCGETPYLSLLSRLYGDRALVANATGCSSIYGGNLPTTPWCANADGRGPAWANSLFEDNAEFGLGFRLALDQRADAARVLLRAMRKEVGPDLAAAILDADQSTEAGIEEQRSRVEALRAALVPLKGPEAARLRTLAEALVRRSVWIVGGDGWAYDIGFGGLDHVLASGADVNVLVLDTEVYSNTGGQASKSTPLGAVARFATGGKTRPKKDMALMAMTYGDVYVARVALGADDAQTLRAFQEAESFPGPSLILAYAHCVAHGVEMREGMSLQRLAVECGAWPLLRYDPRRAAAGKPPLVLDSKAPKTPFLEYARRALRFKMLEKAHPRAAERLFAEAEREIAARRRLYEHLAALPPEAAGSAVTSVPEIGKEEAAPA